MLDVLDSLFNKFVGISIAALIFSIICMIFARYDRLRNRKLAKAGKVMSIIALCTSIVEVQWLILQYFALAILHESIVDMYNWY